MDNISRILFYDYSTNIPLHRERGQINLTIKDILNNNYDTRNIKKYESIPETEKNVSLENVLDYEYFIENPQDKFTTMYNELYNYYSLYKNKFIETANNLILITNQYQDLVSRYKILASRTNEPQTVQTTESEPTLVSTYSPGKPKRKQIETEEEEVTEHKKPKRKTKTDIQRFLAMY